MARVTTSLGPIGYVETGGGDAAPIIFLHGVGSDKSVWQAQLDHFGKARRAIAFDYPGYGESAAGPASADQDSFAATILAALDSLNVERAHVCGLSLGGVVAIALHHAAPHRCASLILADSFAEHPEGQAIYDRAIAASQAGPMRALAEQRAPLLLASDISPDIVAQVVETMAAIDPAAYRVGARAVWLARQADRAREIRVPTLVLVGDCDPITPPPLSQELAALITGAHLAEIAGASHLANLDRAAEFNLEIDRFLTAVEQRS